MTYGQHCFFSLKLALLQLEGFAKAVVHAFLPDTYVTSTSDINLHIRELLEEAGCKRTE